MIVWCAYILIAMAIVNQWRMMLQLDFAHRDQSMKPKNINITVFYNIYEGHKNTPIINEQLALLRPEHKVFVRSIGEVPLEINDDKATILRHDGTGNETETLELLWNHCLSNTNDTVAYIHNKGSFHQHEANHLLRRFLTRGALSEECSNMPSHCNVCSSRMSPFPHPHTPGNMWVARCEYVQKLMHPITLQAKMRARVYNESSSCRGTGRYAAEHWIHSHPSARPCDLSDDDRYTWSYKGIPKNSKKFKMKLQPAPRFKSKKYEKETICPTQKLNYLLWEYEVLYNETPSASWWGWKFYDVSADFLYLIYS